MMFAIYTQLKNWEYRIKTAVFGAPRWCPQSVAAWYPGPYQAILVSVPRRLRAVVAAEGGHMNYQTLDELFPHTVVKGL